MALNDNSSPISEIAVKLAQLIEQLDNRDIHADSEVFNDELVQKCTTLDTAPKLIGLLASKGEGIVALAARQLWDRFGIASPLKVLERLLFSNCEAIQADGVYLLGEYGTFQSVEVLAAFVRELRRDIPLAVLGELCDALIKVKSSLACTLLQETAEFAPRSVAEIARDSAQFVRDVVVSKPDMCFVLAQTTDVLAGCPMWPGVICSGPTTVSILKGAQLSYADHILPGTERLIALCSIVLMKGGLPYFTFRFRPDENISLPSLHGDGTVILTGTKQVQEYLQKCNDCHRSS